MPSTSRHGPDDRPRSLPLLDGGHGSARSALTCRYRCGNACAHPAPNRSANRSFGDVAAEALSRRGVLRGAAALTLTVAGAAAATGATPSRADAAPAPSGRPGTAGLPPGLRFEAVPPNRADAVTVPPGYAQQVVLRWGDPVLAGAPRFDPRRPSARAQRRQFGYNADYLTLLDLPGRDGRHGLRLLVANHEYTSEPLMFYGYDPEHPTREQVEVAWAAHGMSVVVVRTEPDSGRLHPVPGHVLNRRITATTPCVLTGPAAGSPLLRTSADPEGRTVLGTLNNCGGGVTPWGTVLSGEENFDQYFAHADAVADPVTRRRLARYGVPEGASERRWERFDPRFDLRREPNEVNRFGWVVEIDPYDPTATPRKRTALGRFKHEAAEPRVAPDGRVVLYMGDDERFDYLYKFVSARPVARGDDPASRAHNLRLLDEGTLYVARFTGDSPPGQIDGSGRLPEDGAFDGGGEWIPLATGDTSHVPGMSAAEVYVFTRLAADRVGATKMDRPEDVEPHPHTGRLYVALTNNSDRGAAGRPGPDEANPRSGNKHGHVLELEERDGDPTARSFGWRLLLVCGDPEDPGTYFAGFDRRRVSPISCPDNIAFDEHGNLWLATDGNALGGNDGLFAVPVRGPHRGHVRQFLTVPVGAETCGPVVRDGRVLVAAQHPGEVDGASAEEPASHWPDGPGSLPRPSVVAVWRERPGRR